MSDKNGVSVDSYVPITFNPIDLHTFPDFTDPDGDALSYTVGVDDARSTVSIVGTTVTLTLPSDRIVGDIFTVTITANDLKGGTVSTKWIVRII